MFFRDCFNRPHHGRKKPVYTGRWPEAPLPVVTPQNWMPPVPDFAVKDRQRFLGRETETMTPRQWAMLIVCVAGFVVVAWLVVTPMLSFYAP